MAPPEEALVLDSLVDFPGVSGRVPNLSLHVHMYLNYSALEG